MLKGLWHEFNLSLKFRWLFQVRKHSRPNHHPKKTISRKSLAPWMWKRDGSGTSMGFVPVPRCNLQIMICSYSNHQFSGREVPGAQFLQGIALANSGPQNWSQFEASVILLVYYVVSKKTSEKHRHVVFLVYLNVVYKGCKSEIPSILLLSPHHSVIGLFFNPFPLLRQSQAAWDHWSLFRLTWNKMRHLPHASCQKAV